MAGEILESDLYNHIYAQSLSFRSSERSERKESLRNIEEQLGKGKKVSQNEFQRVFVVFLKDFLASLSDEVEFCREKAAVIVNFLLEKLESIDDLDASTIMGVLLMRLTSPDERESSEEVRLLEVRMLHRLVKLSGLKLIPHINDIACILRKCIVDSYPEVKRESCDLTTKYAYVYRIHFQTLSGSFIKPLLLTLTQQHWKTRASCIMAIGSVVQYGDNANFTEVVSHLTQRLFDSMPQVRGTLVHVTGTWLRELPDRYSFFPRMLPLMLSCLLDEVVDVKNKAREYWNKAGQQYLEENEKDYKDQLDFPKELPADYPGTQPSLGCRALVQRHFVTILPPLLKDMDSIELDTKVKAAELLYVLISHCEEKSTIKLHLFIEGIIKAANEIDRKCREEAVKAAQLLGYFTDAQLWSHLFQHRLLYKPTSQHLSILACLIRGSKKNSMANLFLSVSTVLADARVCKSRSLDIQANILLCAEALLLSGNGINESSRYFLFVTLVTVAGSTDSDTMVEKAQEIMTLLSTMSGMKSREELFVKHAMTCIKGLTEHHEAWDSNELDVSIFTYLVKAAFTVADVAEFAVAIIIGNLDQDKDVKLRSGFLRLVATILSKNSTKQILPQKSVVGLVHAGLLPNLVWAGGDIAASLRTIAAANLWEILHSKAIDKDMLTSIAKELFPILKSLSDDDLPKNRQYSCKIMAAILPTVSQALEDDLCVHETVTDFLRCLDDEMDDIRILAVGIFRAYFEAFPKETDYWKPFSAYVQFVFQTLLIHMDDQNETLRMSVFSLLKDMAYAGAEILSEEVEKVRYAMRESELCDKLLNHLKNLSTVGTDKELVVPKV